jgi:hypothetical protein
MAERTSAGTPKWDAVKSALAAFVNDPRSAGISAGLQFFPQRPPGVPARCSTSSQCNGYGPCANRACLGGGVSSYIACATSLDCPSGSQCYDLGTCATDGKLCVYTGPGATCLGGTGRCDKILEADCVNADSCAVSGYADLALPMTALPGGAGAFTARVNAQLLSGNTPTSAALRGAIQRARSEATQRPDHAVAVVLVTDGLPTSCAPTDTSSIAQIAADGAGAKIRTFVVGVFAPVEEAQARTTLDAIARAGGTKDALLVTTSQDVAQALNAALATVRARALPCAFGIPRPASGTLDYGKVNVQLTPGKGGGASVIPMVARAEDCDAKGGWYYDVDPKSGATPSRILTCPATCERLREDGGARVDVLFGCATILK